MNAADAPRPTCEMCVRKHLGQAAVLFQEAIQGYPQHLWLAIGHLAEAEAESQSAYPGFAGLLRHERKKAEEGGYTPDCVLLLDRFKDAMEGDDGMSEEIAGKVASRFVSANKTREAASRVYRFGSAGHIAMEVVENGESVGWAGHEKDVARVEKILAPFNIGYVDDMFGKWARVKGGSRVYR